MGNPTQQPLFEQIHADPGGVTSALGFSYPPGSVTWGKPLPESYDQDRLTLGNLILGKVKSVHNLITN